MPAGVCGKRIGFEEIFGSSSPSSSAKRSRCSNFGSPVRASEFVLGSEDKLCILLRMFPGMERELVESVLKAHNHKIDDAIESLHALCLGVASSEIEQQGIGSMIIANGPTHPGGESCQTIDPKVENLQENGLTIGAKNPIDGSIWVDIFVQEMMNATDLDDARNRATRVLETFEKNGIANSRASEEQEISSLKEHLQSLFRNNHILKRAVAIQHERNIEQEEKLREVEQLKHVISQYQEQVRNLELNNYTLKLHLQRAEESNSIPGRFHPDIF